MLHSKKRFSLLETKGLSNELDSKVNQIHIISVAVMLFVYF